MTTKMIPPFLLGFFHEWYCTFMATWLCPYNIQIYKLADWPSVRAFQSSSQSVHHYWCVAVDRYNQPRPTWLQELMRI